MPLYCQQQSQNDNAHIIHTPGPGAVVVVGPLLMLAGLSVTLQSEEAAVDSQLDSSALMSPLALVS